MMTDAWAGPLVAVCDSDGVTELDAEGLAAGVKLAFGDGLGVTVAVGFGVAAAVGFGVMVVAVGFAGVLDLVVAGTAVGLGIGDVAGVDDAGVGSTNGVGGAGCGKLGTATADETAACDAGALAAGAACAVALECTSREIASVPTTRTATPAAAATAVMTPRPRCGDSPDCDNGHALLCSRHPNAHST